MKKIITLISLGLLTIGAVAISWIAPFYLLWSIVFTVCAVATYGFLLITWLINHKWYKLGLVANILVLFVVMIFAIFYYTGLLSHFSTLEQTREWFESFGAWTWVIYFIIQIAQVVILPIPAQITTIAGVLILGAWKAFVISAVAILLGSYVCFAIGRWFGVKIAYKIASKETVDKYRNLLTKKGKLLLPIMFLFPAFPDDLLCFVAGTTKMTWRYFIVITLLTRLIGIACTCWLGSGDLIPFSGWGIPVWIALGIILIFAIYFIFKYQEQIEEWIIVKFTKDGKKKLAEKKRKETEKVIDEQTQKSQQDNANYVNFENGKQTKDNYINFENLNSSNGTNNLTDIEK